MKDDIITISHGSGGKFTTRFIKDYVVKYFNNPILSKLTDAAVLSKKCFVSNNIAFTIDGYTVNPIFFPGGDIGKLSVCGTINDLSAVGAKPVAIACSLIIQEGIETKIIDKILCSMKNVCKEENVDIVTGDTKVVEKTACDKIFIITAGIGIIENNLNFDYQKIKPKDKIIVTGNIAEHGFAILLSRGSYGFSYKIKSDCSALWKMIRGILNFGDKIKFMRDPTRGGLSAVLNEIVEKKMSIGIKIFERDIPISKKVSSISEILGMDPLYVANEGKMVLIVEESVSEQIIKILHKHPLGKNAKIIGEVTKKNCGKVILENIFGSSRIIDMPVAEQLPRIC
ncbi:MAG: hydrogenase expression/formation protein HypE [Endomicrobiia bacterium]